MCEGLNVIKIYSDIGFVSNFWHEYIWTYVYGNVLIWIYSDVHLCWNVHDCPMMPQNWNLDPKIALQNPEEQRTQNLSNLLNNRWPPDCISKFGHRLAPLSLVPNLGVLRWGILTIITRRSHLHQLEIGSPGGTTCIGSKFGHLVAPLALVPKLAARLHHCIATLPLIALLALSV